MYSKKAILLLVISAFLLAISVFLLYPYKNGFENYSVPVVVYYINLEHRLDRNEEFLEEMRRIRFPMEKVERIDAIYDKRGHLGCTKSHIKTLERFIASGHSNCIVFEDDFEFVNPETAFAKIESVFNRKIPFDVIMLSGSWVDSTPMDDFVKINYAQTTSGYMVSKDFAPILLENFKEGSKLLEESYRDTMEGKYAIDQYWCSLMPKSRWYGFNPFLGKQRSSYSDIMGGSVDYGL